MTPFWALRGGMLRDRAVGGGGGDASGGGARCSPLPAFWLSHNPPALKDIPRSLPLSARLVRPPPPKPAPNGIREPPNERVCGGRDVIGPLCACAERFGAGWARSGRACAHAWSGSGWGVGALEPGLRMRLAVRNGGGTLEPGPAPRTIGRRRPAGPGVLRCYRIAPRCSLVEGS